MTRKHGFRRGQEQNGPAAGAGSSWSRRWSRASSSQPDSDRSRPGGWLQSVDLRHRFPEFWYHRTFRDRLPGHRRGPGRAIAWATCVSSPPTQTARTRQRCRPSPVRISRAANTTGIARVGTNIYLMMPSRNQIGQISDDGTLERVAATVPSPLGVATRPA